MRATADNTYKPPRRTRAVLALATRHGVGVAFCCSAPMFAEQLILQAAPRATAAPCLCPARGEVHAQLRCGFSLCCAGRRAGALEPFSRGWQGGDGGIFMIRHSQPSIEVD
ncbi:unnamed protein product [Prorocentrum cordatum]|uniref:Uncharacterized protein n=1 Tax=Prorocentrum cordatum TaxID=2364126 RepID=A0ABN9THC7_9DINO|nr:unnamed protein product [Polarella glacialis]